VAPQRREERRFSRRRSSRRRRSYARGRRRRHQHRLRLRLRGGRCGCSSGRCREEDAGSRGARGEPREGSASACCPRHFLEKEARGGKLCLGGRTGARRPPSSGEGGARSGDKLSFCGCLFLYLSHVEKMCSFRRKGKESFSFLYVRSTLENFFRGLLPSFFWHPFLNFFEVFGRNSSHCFALPAPLRPPRPALTPRVSPPARQARSRCSVLPLRPRSRRETRR
jgi:hypothetical protein